MLLPRKKAASSSTTDSWPVKATTPGKNQVVAIDRESVAQFFHLPIHEAARHLNICVTSLKKVCRRLGYNRWPYVKPSKANPRADVDPLLETLTTSTHSHHATSSLDLACTSVDAGSSHISMTETLSLLHSSASENYFKSDASFPPSTLQPAQDFKQHFTANSAGALESSHRSAFDWNSMALSPAPNRSNFSQEPLSLIEGRVLQLLLSDTQRKLFQGRSTACVLQPQYASICAGLSGLSGPRNHQPGALASSHLSNQINSGPCLPTSAPFMDWSKILAGNLPPSTAAPSLRASSSLNHRL